MMSKIPVILLLSATFVFALGGGPKSVYKKEGLKLVGERGYGGDTAWASYLGRSPKIAAASDGSLFVLDPGGCRVSKFDRGGKFVLTFGKEGQGPGQLDQPGDISILDDKYVVVADNPANRKITLFDLHGRFVTVLNTQKWLYECVGLKDGKIALVCRENLPRRTFRLAVTILDTRDGSEKILAEETVKIKMLRKINFFLQDPNLHNNAFIRKLPGGNLVLGYSFKNALDIYTPAGKKIKTFNLGLKEIKVDDTVVKGYMDNYLDTAARLRWRLPGAFVGRFQNSLGAVKTLFGDHLPLYGSMFVDGRGRILVFEYTRYRLEKSPTFRVYSDRGQYLGTSALDFVDFTPPLLDARFDGFCFMDDALFAILGDRTGDRVVKIILK